MKASFVTTMFLMTLLASNSINAFPKLKINGCTEFYSLCSGRYSNTFPSTRWGRLWCFCLILLCDLYTVSDTIQPGGAGLFA